MQQQYNSLAAIHYIVDFITLFEVISAKLTPCLTLGLLKITGKDESATSELQCCKMLNINLVSKL